jgi:hypothetical protein
MGGFGSTRWAWASTKETVEGNRRLDINRLRQAGCLQPGYWGSWEWKQDGERVAWIQFRREGDRLVLSYRVRHHGGEWQDVEQPTLIAWTPCRFGGVRPYFVCPGVVNGIACGRRVAKLYGAETYFLCRYCYRLGYASQREDRYDRAFRRANKIRMRLGGEPGLAALFPDRPKGMHRQTYQRLQSAVFNAEILAEEQIAVLLARLQRSDRRREHRSVAGRRSKEFWR